MNGQKALVSLLLDNRVCVYRPQQNSVATYNNVIILEPGQKFNANREYGWYEVPEEIAQSIMIEWRQIDKDQDALEEFNLYMRDIEREYK